MDFADDFTLPDGASGIAYDINNLENLHNGFGMKCKKKNHSFINLINEIPTEIMNKSLKLNYN